MSGQLFRLRCFLRKICYKILIKPVGSFWDHTYRRGAAAIAKQPAWHYPGWTHSHVGRVVYIFSGPSRAAGVTYNLQPPSLWSPEEHASSSIAQGRLCSAQRWSLFSAAWVLWSLLALPHNEVSCLTDVLGSPCVRKEMPPLRSNETYNHEGRIQRALSRHLSCR